MTSIRHPQTFNSKKHNCDPTKLVAVTRDARKDIPLRAKSVCLAERSRSQYGRAVKSADPNRLRYGEKQFLHRRPQSTVEFKRPSVTNKVVVKQQKRKVIEKIPCAISVQTLSIPTKYVDNPKHSTSARRQRTFIEERAEGDNIKWSNTNPPAQVSEKKRLCQTVNGGKETENKLLLQISEAEQVTDFERILNSNTILCERNNRHVWRGCKAHASSAASSLRPRSSYSLYAVSQAYHYLFQQHEDSLQPLLDQYRQETTDEHKNCTPASLLGKNWYENLHELSEFYEEDRALKKELETIADQIVTEEVKVDEQTQPATGRNFNVNLADLIGLRVHGEGYSPLQNHDDLDVSVDEKADEADDEKEWLDPIMSSHSDARQRSRDDADQTVVDCLAQSLNSVQIDSNEKVPTITFSNYCCDARDRSNSACNNNVAIHLAVPSIDSIDESRPPMM